MYFGFIIALALCREVLGFEHFGSKVYEIVPENPDHQHILDLLHSTSGFDFWSSSRLLEHPAIVLVKPYVMDTFNNIMQSNNFKHKELINDVGRLLEEKRPGMCYCRSTMNQNFSLSRYNSYNSIKTFLRNLEKDYPNKIDLFRIGRTIEGRDILIVKISKGEESPNKPAIVIDAGIHAREWIGPATALFLIHQLVEMCNTECMIGSVDWYIIPLLNPDGYEYSMKVNRLWRKNRSKGRFCTGVDPNRNFNFHWMQGGSSADECSETYAGYSPFSERESKALRDFILEHRENIKLYITLHSYGKFILYPWNYSPEPPEDVTELHNLAQSVCDAIETVSGTQYTTGASNTMLYQASGNSEDWVKGVAGVELSFAIELPGGGINGFDVPEEELLKVGKETFAGIKVFWQHVAKRFANKRDWRVILKR